jgi:ParB-like chromosome segregation protein Spo0J
LGVCEYETVRTVCTPKSVGHQDSRKIASYLIKILYLISDALDAHKTNLGIGSEKIRVPIYFRLNRRDDPITFIIGVVMPISDSLSLVTASADENAVWKYTEHQYAAIFPMMKDKEIAELAEDIKKNGLRAPIVLHKNKILDGRNRFKACKLAGVVPYFVNYSGHDPLNAVISLNLKRRHLNTSQRGYIADEIATMKLGDNQGAHRPKKGSAILPTLLDNKISQAEAAEKLQVSERTVRDAKVVKKLAPAESVQDIVAGKRTINSVLKEFKARPNFFQTDAAKLTRVTTSNSASLSPEDEKEIDTVLKKINDTVNRMIMKYGEEKLRKNFGEKLNDLADLFRCIADPEFKE